MASGALGLRIFSLNVTIYIRTLSASAQLLQKGVCLVCLLPAAKLASGGKILAKSHDFGGESALQRTSLYAREKCVQGVERWPPACGWRAEAAAPHHRRLGGPGQQHKDRPIGAQASEHWCCTAGAAAATQTNNAELTLLTRRPGVPRRAGAGDAAAASARQLLR